MADSIKRIQWSRDLETQDRVLYYLFQKAKATKSDAAATADERALSDRIYNKSVNVFAACMVCATNASIGAAIDAGNAVNEADIEYVVVTDQWLNLAAAGV